MTVEALGPALGGLFVLVVGFGVLCAVGAVIVLATRKFLRGTGSGMPPPLPGGGPLPYTARGYLFTRAERSFYEVLRRVVGDGWTVFAKVRLSDVLNVPRGTAGWQAHFNRVQAKHVDFVVCDTKELRIGLVIELDDSSHGQPARRDRDDFVNGALTAAKVPFLRVPVRAGYNPGELRAQLEALLGQATRVHEGNSGEHGDIASSGPVGAVSANGK